LHEGGAPMSSQIARKVVFAFRDKPIAAHHSPGIEQLSHREKQILENFPAD
jgi:DNA-binding NarL/FixJ family response regulator